MKKILFILGMYHPKYSANGLCTKNVVDELVKEGYDVSCICNGSRKNVKQEIVDGAHLYYIKPRLYQIINEMADEEKYKKSKYFLQKLGVLLNKTQLGMMSALWPMVSPIYAARFYGKAKELYKKEQYDTIISVYTPFEALLAGWLIKKKFSQIKFIPYYLDALAGGWGPSFFSELKIEKHTQKWEKRIDKDADCIISMHSSKKYHAKSFGDIEKKRIFLDVPVIKKSYICEREEPFALYAGSLNFKGRGLEKLLDIFYELNSKIEMKLLLAGPCNDTKIFERYTKISQGKIRYLGKLEHKEVLELEKKAKYLINLGNNNPYTIPSKIFEYMRFGKTIISTFQIEQEPSIEYLNKYKNVIYIDENMSTEEIVNNLIQDIQMKKNVEKIDLESVFYYNTPRAFVNLIKEI